MDRTLTPAAVESRLTTRWLGRPLQVEAQVDSTNSRLHELARRGAAAGLVLVADSQTSGRGRQQRQWHSPPGTNLYFSVLLRPDWPVGATPPLSLAAGVALAEAMGPLLPAPPVLKWPNDLLFQGRKLAGILVEAQTDRQAVRHAIVGIGVNVNQDSFPEELAERAGSLRTVSGQTHDRAEVLARLLGALESWIERLQTRPAEVLETWQRYAPWLGRPIVVTMGQNTLAGTALGLAPDGTLRMRDAGGREQTILSGDVEQAAY